VLQRGMFGRSLFDIVHAPGLPPRSTGRTSCRVLMCMCRNVESQRCRLSRGAEGAKQATVEKWICRPCRDLKSWSLCP
jgi:hypothetical protein